LKMSRNALKGRQLNIRIPIKQALLSKLTNSESMTSFESLRKISALNLVT
jgi:hypothetical protein